MEVQHQPQARQAWCSRPLELVQATATYLFGTTSQQQTYAPQPDGSLKSLSGNFVWKQNPDGTLHGDLFFNGANTAIVTVKRCSL